MTRRAARNDISDHFDSADIADPIEPADPIENTDANEPAEPIDNTLPTEPIERIEPFEPIESSECSDHNDRRHVGRFEARIAPACRAGDQPGNGNAPCRRTSVLDARRSTPAE